MSELRVWYCLHADSAFGRKVWAGLLTLFSTDTSHHDPGGPSQGLGVPMTWEWQPSLGSSLFCSLVSLALILCVQGVNALTRPFLSGGGSPADVFLSEPHGSLQRRPTGQVEAGQSQQVVGAVPRAAWCSC